MKIRDIYIEDYKGIKDLNISFENDGEILNTVVIIGENGSGKTRVLESIVNFWLNTEKINFYLENNERKVLESFVDEDKEIQEKDFAYYLTKFKYYRDRKNQDEKSKMIVRNFENLKKIPKIIYVPVVVSFDTIETETTNLELEYNFINIIDSNIIKNISSYIVSKVIKTILKEKKMTSEQAMEKVFREINEIFDILEMDVKICDIIDSGNKPIFSNSSGEKFDINELSSGEKQLFLRTLAIKMLEPENSIIMIDEPEISLHPKWQQKIIKVYEKIGKNNQIILATHSPHILGSVKKENIILLNKNLEGNIEVKTGEELYDSYGQPVDRILKDIMGLETTRDFEVFELLNEIRKMVDENNYESIEFKEKFKKARGILGLDDEDLFLINMDIQIKKGRKNAENR